jgi:GH25 family lysozyme M1 (1,4-beta-N-acetylmuramidase)
MVGTSDGKIPLKNGFKEIAMANVIGPDVSFYQDDPETPQGIDFVKMKASAGFVIIRAGQNLWPDPDFKFNWREARKAGLPRGSYWFYDSRADPAEQAGLWISLFEGDLGELPLFADFEENYQGPYKGWRKWYDFLEELKKLAPGREISIYTAFYYWRDNAPNATTQATSLEYFHQYPLWIANYSATKPSVPKPWTPDEWLFWQYTEVGDGKLYGVETNGIDLNYFNGDQDALKTRFNIPALPLPTPEPEPPPGGGTQTGKQHKVTTAALRVREGPGTNFNVIGMVHLNDIVDELEATNDHSWIRIQNQNGLIGWCSSAYLIEISPTPPPPPPVEPPPPPGDETRLWFRVDTSALTVRATPAANGKVLGYLLKDDTVQGRKHPAHAEWTEIQRLDGLSGWCSDKYLKQIGEARPAEVRQAFFKGITYLRKEISNPRRNVVHIAVIDLRTKGYEFLVTPTKDPNGIMCTRTTSKFVDDFNVHLAINGDGFYYMDASHNAQLLCPNGGDPVKPNGLAASRGNLYSRVRSSQPTVYISSANQVTFTRPGKVFNAVSGDRIVVEKGKIPPKLATNIENPRTAIGLSVNGRYLLFFVIDGRQPGYSEGVTLPELSSIMIAHGVYTGVNMDGGGSSTLVIRGVDGRSRVLNSPIEQNLPGRERAVANHLGIFVKS